MRINGPDLVRLIEQAERLEDFERAVSRAVAAGPADAGSIVEFFDVPTADAFNVPAEQAINYFKAKGLKPTFSYADMLGAANDHAFTVAKMMDVDLLGQVSASLESALANGTSFKEWSDSLLPILQSAGWWGRQEVLDPLTGQTVVAQLGSPWRLETIFRTNMQTAYAAGAWQEIQSQADVAPYLMYDAVDDFRTREQHRLWDRKILPASSPWWKTHYPPNGWNCRCGVIQLDATEVKRLGLSVSDVPDDGTYTWTNPRTGVKLRIPNGIDPGFDRNAGVTYQADLDKLLDDKIDALPQSLKVAAQQAQAEMDKISAQMDAAQAEAALAIRKAEAAAAENLSAYRARVLAASKELEAQAQLDAIGQGKEAVGGAGAQYKVKALAQLKKTDAWPELKPTEKLAQVEAQAAALKLQNETASKVAAYKKAVIDGKTPAPNQVKAFNSLSAEDQAKVVQDIESKQAAIAAAKAAEAEATAKAAAAAANAEAPPTQKAASLIDDGGPDPANLVMVGRKTKGATEGALYQDATTGIKYMVKFNGSEDAVRNEVLAGKLYQLAGVEAPDLYSINIGGRNAIASRIVDGIKEVDALTLARTDSVMDGFAVDAWLANWDSIGLNYDNTVLIGGRALRIDVGGSLRYRAVGGLKGSAFGDMVGEMDSLRDRSLNRTSYEVFKNITDAQIEASVIRVLRVSDDDIRSLVEQYGPLDDIERQQLADRLIARKEYLAKRYPNAAAKARATDAAANDTPPAVARVTDTEQQFVEQSRVNGYGFATDGDQIEDQMVIVNTYKTADGSDATRGFFKLREDASRDLAKRILQDVGDGAPTVALSEARDAVLAAVKSINFRADKGSPFDATCVTKVQTAIKALDRTIAELKAVKTLPSNQASFDFVNNELQRWRGMLSTSLPMIEQFGPAQKVSAMFPAGQIPDALFFEAQAAKKSGPATWQRIKSTYEFKTASFERSFAKQTGGKASVQGVSVYYEGKLQDGTVVRYFPHEENVAFAMRGIVQIDAAGKGAASTSKVFDTIENVGLDARRAELIDRQHLYLNAFARLRLIRSDMTAWRNQFDAITGNDAEALTKKLDVLRRATGVDIDKTEGWRRIDGVRQAFGHGRAYQLRPDLDTPEFESFAREYVLFHNPQGLGSDAGSGVFERVKTVIDGGGTFASLVDRVRRGVPLSGSSVASDLQTGGGDYLFTRIKKRGSGSGSGIYWKPSIIKRMDAVTYDSDQFGRVTPGHMENNRLGQTVDTFKNAARSGSNETIFKGGISVFDDIDRIVLSTLTEVNDAILWMQAKGYKTWPDGRKLDEVIITKAQNNARP